MKRVGDVLLDSGPSYKVRGDSLKSWKVATEAFDMAPGVANSVYQALSVDFKTVQNVLGPPEEHSLMQVRA